MPSFATSGATSGVSSVTPITQSTGVSNGVIFPGQGSQRSGMGLDFKEKDPAAAAVFARASTALGWDVADVCQGRDERINLSEFTQPCILTAEIAMFNMLKTRFGFNPQIFAGHSLGEYSALVAAEALPFEVAARLVHARGQLMQSCIEPGLGAMAALILENLPFTEIEEITDQFNVDIANDNSSSQVVLSGTVEDVQKASEKIRDTFAGRPLRLVPLVVSAPFHSRWMAKAESEFAAVLQSESHQFKPNHATRVISNFTGRFHTADLGDLLKSLAAQITGRVRWRDNMSELHRSCDALIEVGPGRPLSGFCRTQGIPVTAIIDLRSAERLFQPPQEMVQEQTPDSRPLL